MTISDLIPVQFWLIDCPTYNESEPFGVNTRCFCQIFECDDEIKIQFQHSTGSSFSLLIYDNEDSLLDSIPFEETSTGVYFVSFIPSENTPGICDQQIKLQIRQEPGQQAISLPDLSTWSQTSTSDVDWTLGSNPSVSLPSSNVNSEILWVDYAFIPGVEYTIIINYNATGGTFSQTDVSIMDSSFNVLFQTGVDVIGGTGSHSTNPLTFTATSDTTKIGMFVSGTPFQSTSVTLQSTSATRSIGSSEVLAKSDCIYLQQQHEGSVLISYSNARNFAGVISNNGSPDLTFYLRIPAVFFQERFPETDETEELSDNRIISLNSQVKAQKLLETDQMPFYMHRKMKLVLKNQFVTIDDGEKSQDYVKEEPYEEVENANKRWPMRRATCWLTEKEYVIRNIL